MDTLYILRSKTGTNVVFVLSCNNVTFIQSGIIGFSTENDTTRKPGNLVCHIAQSLQKFWWQLRFID